LFSFEVELNFFMKSCLFLRFKNAFKNKFCLPLLQIKIFIFFPFELFFKIIPILSYYQLSTKKRKRKRISLRDLTKATPLTTLPWNYIDFDCKGKINKFLKFHQCFIIFKFFMHDSELWIISCFNHNKIIIIIIFNFGLRIKSMVVIQY
jgi:hypothetical protein